MRRRKINVQRNTRRYDGNDGYSPRRMVVESHICPSGYHWVSAHYRSEKFGFRRAFVEGHCTKNGTDSGMKIAEIEKRRKIKTPFYEAENIIREKPVDNGDFYKGSEE